MDKNNMSKIKVGIVGVGNCANSLISGIEWYREYYKNNVGDAPGLVNEFIIKYNGFEYTQNKMLNYKNKAIEILEKFPNNESRDSIKTLLDYIIERKY